MWFNRTEAERKIIDRGIEKYTSKKSSDRGCIFWLAYSHPRGAPKYSYTYQQRTVCINVPKYLLEQFLGRGLKSNHQANHTCDNVDGPCINLDHIYEGTPQQNIDDMYARNRQPERRGPNGPNSFLTLPQVIEIREKLATKRYTNTQLAREYNVNDSCISKIKLNKRWVV